MNPQQGRSVTGATLTLITTTLPQRYCQQSGDLTDSLKGVNTRLDKLEAGENDDETSVHSTQHSEDDGILPAPRERLSPKSEKHNNEI